MNHLKGLKFALVAALLAISAGCATKTVVVPKSSHHHLAANGYVVYTVKPARRHCWKHAGHWHCR